MSRLQQSFLNVGTVFLTVGALVAVGIRIRDHYTAPSAGPAHVFPIVDEWEGFSRHGARSGPSSATVTIVEFGDYLCPICARAAPYIATVLRQNPEDVAVVFRHFPYTDLGFQAAAAAICAGTQGRFESFHHLLFAKRDEIGEREWADFAADAGVPDTEAFAACLETGESLPDIARDTADAHLLGLLGTPSYLVNNVRVTGFLGGGVMDSLILESKRMVRHR